MHLSELIMLLHTIYNQFLSRSLHEIAREHDIKLSNNLIDDVPSFRNANDMIRAFRVSSIFQIHFNCNFNAADNSTTLTREYIARASITGVVRLHATVLCERQMGGSTEHCMFARM